MKADADARAGRREGGPVWLFPSSHLKKDGGGAWEGGVELGEQEEGSPRSGPRNQPKASRGGRAEEEVRRGLSEAGSWVVSLRWNQIHGEHDRTGY